MIWNLECTEPIKLAQVEHEMNKYNLLFLGFSEFRWPECGEQRKNYESFFIFSGKPSNEPRSSNIGFLLSKEAKKSLIEWHPHENRIIFMRLKTDTTDRQIKDEFYSRLSSVMAKHFGKRLKFYVLAQGCHVFFGNLLFWSTTVVIFLVPMWLRKCLKSFWLFKPIMVRP